MPNYEYECPKCKTRFERMLTVAEFATKRPTCPECKARARHVLYAPAVHMRYSLMHPRHMRGQKGKPKPQKGNVI